MHGHVCVCVMCVLRVCACVFVCMCMCMLNMLRCIWIECELWMCILVKWYVFHVYAAQGVCIC